MAMADVVPSLMLASALTLGCGSSGVQESGSGSEDCPELIWTEPGDGTHSLELSASDIEDLPEYTVIDGNLRIREIEGITDLAFLRCVTEIRGGLVISNNPDLVSLDGLERLTSMVSPRIEYDHIAILENPKLQHVDGLSGVEGVGTLSVTDNPALESLDGLASFRQAQTISISGNDALEIIGLRALETVEEIYIGATTCPPWDPNTEPAPSPIAAGNSQMTTIDGLDSLASYTRLRIDGNSSLSSLSALSDNLKGAIGMFVEIELNAMLPHEQIMMANLPGSVDACGNLDDPETCQCELVPGNP